MNYLVTDEQLTATADAIREKTGGTDLITWDESKGFADVVSGISAGGGGDIDALIDGSITEVKSNALSVRKYAFNNHPNISKVDLPLVETVYDSAFAGCSLLTSVKIPRVVKIEGTAFSYCSKLSTVDLPSAIFIGSSAFGNCSELSLVNFFADGVSFQSRVFQYCSKLTKVILKSNTVCNLVNVNIFSSTPFASGGTGGTVYVPSALITEYQNATNWSTLYAAGTCNFVAIEGSEYE